ncbi:transposase [Agathobacter rectalis]|uniref:transposase n=1 Tax=Agathobacter rectalis TaxID=39491 RepID=UPI002FE5FAAA
MAGRKKRKSKIQCDNYKYHVKALEVMPDYIHIFVDVPQTVAPCDIVRTLKSISVIEL